MSFDNGPKIVTNGLVLSLDAADRNSYVSGSTTWNDISGNGNNGTLTFGPTFSSANGGSIVFDGINDQVSLSQSITLSAATFMCFIYRNGTQTQWSTIFMGGGGGTWTGINYRDNTGNIFGYHWRDAANTFNWNSGLAIPNLQWCMVAVSITSTSAIAYLYQASGNTSATNNVTHNSVTVTNIKIGSFGGDSRFMNGNMGNMLVYNRALSASEISQNYNAIKSRFGL